MPPPLPPGGPGALPAPHNHAPSDPRPWHPAGQGLGQRVRDGSSEYFTVIAGRQYSFVTWAYDEYNNRQTSGSPGFRMNAGACLGCTLGGAETDRRQPGVQDGCGCVPGRSVTIWAFGGGGGGIEASRPSRAVPALAGPWPALVRTCSTLSASGAQAHAHCPATAAAAFSSAAVAFSSTDPGDGTTVFTYNMTKSGSFTMNVTTAADVGIGCLLGRGCLLRCSLRQRCLGPGGGAEGGHVYYWGGGGGGGFGKLVA